MTRWPAEPLLRLVGAADSGMKTSAAAARFGVARETIARWRRHGVPTPYADRCALQLGLHPANVWPGWCEGLDTPRVTDGSPSRVQQAGAA